MNQEKAHSKHSSLPWYTTPHHEYSGSPHRIDNKKGAHWENYGEIAREHKGNAEFIVKACNNYYQLVEALRKLSKAFYSTVVLKYGHGDYLGYEYQKAQEALNNLNQQAETNAENN